MKTYIALLIVSIGTAILLGVHEYSMYKDMEKAKQLFARTLCLSFIITGAMTYYLSSTRSLMNEPFDVIGSPQPVMLQTPLQSSVQQVPGGIRY